MKSKTRILVVEDESDVKDLMSLHLGRLGHEVLSCEDGESALQELENGRIDLAVLDWMLPKTSGLEICQRIAGRIPVLMVTARAGSDDIIQGLEAGADDYVTKPFEIGVFLARVQALLRRTVGARTDAEAELGGLPGLVIDANARAIRYDGKEISLTPSKFKLLAMLLKNRGRVLSRPQLIQLVHGPGINVVDRTIDTLVFGLRQKLGPHGDFVETVRGVGYRVKPPERDHSAAL